VSGTSGMGAAVGPLLAGLHAALPALDATAGRHLVGHAIDLVASTFFLDDPGNSDERRARLLHAQRFIRASLADDNLSPATVADALNMSVGHLHRLFRGTGMTVGQTIRQARLERCAAELRETAHGAETVSEIAFRHGFKDAAHFTRAFTRRYGVPPSQWRNAGTMPAG
jgi:AraC-like DNA-binding protein